MVTLPEEPFWKHVVIILAARLVDTVAPLEAELIAARLDQTAHRYPSERADYVAAAEQIRGALATLAQTRRLALDGREEAIAA